MKDQSLFTPKNNREWFLYYFFTDPEFVTAKQQIIHELYELMGKEATGISLLLIPDVGLVDHLRDRANQSVAPLVRIMNADKPNYIFSEKSTEAYIIDKIEQLAERFGVSSDTVELGIKYSNFAPGLAFNSVPSVTTEHGKVVIRLSGTMKYADIEAVYPRIAELLSKLPDYKARNRSLDVPSLMYAIHKQRLKKVKFSQIYTLYESGTLPGYNGSNSVTDAKELGKKYRNYMKKSHLTPPVK